MYYEEMLIRGVLMYRNNPKGDWRQVSREEMSLRCSLNDRHASKESEDEERALILLKATHDLLKKCDEGVFVKNALEETTFYDDVECDGYCLMTDIGNLLGIEEED